MGQRDWEWEWVGGRALGGSESVRGKGRVLPGDGRASAVLRAGWRWRQAGFEPRASGFTRSPRGDQSCGLERASSREPSGRSVAHF